MKKLAFLLVMLLSAGLFVSCENRDYELSVEDPIPTKLKVYAIGDHVRTNYGEEFYTSRILLGEFSAMAEMWGEKGHMYYDAIRSFEDETGINIEIQYFTDTYELLRALEEDSVKGTGPDIILGGYTCQQYNLYPYINEGYFVDLTQYFEDDEIYTNGEYVSKVLEAGRVGNKQYIFPLTFNMNMLFTSAESMKRHEFWISEDMTYKDMVTIFSEGWQQENREEDEHLLMQYTNMRNTYPVVLFQASSGENLIDYETGVVQLDEAYFYELLSLYEAYLCNDYNMTREELRDLAKLNDGYLPSDYSKYEQVSIYNMRGENQLDRFDALLEDTVFWAEGGNCSYNLHSFATQAYYYDSRYTDSNEEFICIAIPSRSNEDSYAALVTTFGAVMSSSKYPEYGYMFIKELADNEKWEFWDLPINKDNISNTLGYMGNTYYELYPALGNFPPEREPEGANWLGDSYVIKPMSEKTVDYIKSMVEKIGVAKLPEYRLNNIITTEIASYIYGNTQTREEAYKNALRQLEIVALYN